MGVKRLKIKDELHYRPGRMWQYCSHCNHHTVLNPEAAFRDFEYRCRLIGLNPGRQYRINPGYICDKYDNSNFLKRLRECWACNYRDCEGIDAPHC